MNFCLNLFNLYFMFSFFSSRFLLKVLPQIFKHILPSDDFCWTIIILKLILVKIILGCTWDSLYFMYILIVAVNQICGHIMFLRCCHRCFNVGYWHRMIYIYMKKKTKFTDRLQFTKGGCFVEKKDICLFVDGLLKEDVIMLNLYPDLKQEEMEDSKREFIFVIDRSGKLYLLLIDLVSYYLLSFTMAMPTCIWRK